MKKGLILALLMVAMLALVFPAGAKAPIVKNLPTVIVGDADDVDAVSSKTLMRFYNAFGLNDPQYVAWNNDDSYTSDLFHAYYYQAAAGGTTVKMYNESSAVAPLNASEYSNLLLGTVPPAATRLTSATAAGDYQYFKANFFDAGLHNLASPKTATAAANGYAYDAASTYSAEVELTLVCGVTSGTKLVVSNPTAGVFTVFCNKGEVDGAAKSVTEVANLDFSQPAVRAAWTYSTYGSNAVYASPTKVDSSAGIGFDAGTTPLVSGSLGTGGAMYAKWQSAASLLDVSDADNGLVYKAVATLTGNGTTQATVPGCRFSVQNVGVTHAFYTQSSSKTSTDGVYNVPTSSTPFEGRLYWQVPLNLNDMGDTGVIATGQTTDNRDYQFSIDLIAVATQFGQLRMSNLVIEKFARPAVTASLAGFAWGTPNATSDPGRTAGANFNATGNTWAAAAAVTGYTNVPATISSTNVSLTVGSAGTLRYTAADAPRFQMAKSNNLYRYAVELSCSDRAKVPWNRFFFNHNVGRRASFQQRYLFNTGNIFKRTNVGAGQGRYTGQIYSPMAPALNTGAPSLLEFYLWSHNQSTTLTENMITTSFQIYDGARWDAAPTYADGEWDRPDANMIVTYAGWEDLGTEF